MLRKKIHNDLTSVTKLELQNVQLVLFNGIDVQLENLKDLIDSLRRALLKINKMFIF